MQRRRGKVHVQCLGSVEFRDRQRPDEIVEVTRISLSDWLKVLYAIKHNTRVQDGSNVRGFFE